METHFTTRVRFNTGICETLKHHVTLLERIALIFHLFVVHYWKLTLTNQSYRIPMNYLLVNMAVGDMFQATFHITELVYSHIATHPDGFTGKVVCVIRNGAIQWIGASSSIFTLVVIALERYFSVVYPYANKGKLTMRKLKVCHCKFILSVGLWLA